MPKSIVDRAHDYLRDCTTANGGVIYSLAHGGAFNGAERPPLTAAAIACLFSAGEYKSELAKKWFKFCQRAIPIDKTGSDSFGRKRRARQPNPNAPCHLKNSSLGGRRNNLDPSAPVRSKNLRKARASTNTLARLFQ